MQDFDDIFEEELSKLHWSIRLLYKMQDHVILVTSISFILGYILALKFGVFW